MFLLFKQHILTFFTFYKFFPKEILFSFNLLYRPRPPSSLFNIRNSFIIKSFLNNSSGVPYCDRIRRYIIYYNCPSSNNTPLPILTPDKITTLEPIHTSSSIVIGPFEVLDIEIESFKFKI